MRLDHHIHLPSEDKILTAISKLRKDTNEMGEALRASVDALVAEVAESNGKLESVKAFLVGLPDLVAAAVADALAAANVEEAEAAAQIDAARQAISDEVDAVEAAINAEPAPAPEVPAEEPPAAEPEA